MLAANAQRVPTAWHTRDTKAYHSAYAARKRKEDNGAGIAATASADAARSDSRRQQRLNRRAQQNAVGK